MKIIISFDISDGKPDKAVKLYDMRGNRLGIGSIVLNRPVTNEATLFVPTTGIANYQADLDDVVLASYLQPDTAIFTPEQWRKRYFSNSFVVPEFTEEEWDKYVKEWKTMKGQLVFLPEVKSSDFKIDLNKTKIPEEKKVIEPTIPKKIESSLSNNDIDNLLAGLM